MVSDRHRHRHHRHPDLVKHPVIEKNIFRSSYNVNVDTLISYKKDGVKHHFLDEY